MNGVIAHEQSNDGGVFHLAQDGRRIAELTYRRIGKAWILIDHTEVDVSLRGHGVARSLLDAAVAWARDTGTKVSASCSYVTLQFERDPSIGDVLFLRDGDPGVVPT